MQDRSSRPARNAWRGLLEPPPALANALALTSALAALAIARVVDPYLDTYTILPSVGAVLLAAWFGGFWPSIVATVVSVIGLEMYFVDPRGTLEFGTTSDAIRLAFFVLVSLGASSASRSLRHAALRADAEARAAREFAAQLEASSASLARANEELRQANEELEATAYAIAHDLRTPLRSIDASVARLLGTTSTREEEVAPALTRVRAQVHRMAQMLDGLLALARVGRGTLSRTRIDLTAMARSIADELGAAQPGRNVEWRIAEGLTATGDPRLVRVVLQNLLGNAWKFTRERERAEITIDSREVDGERFIRVADNGAGFDPEFAGQLFRPFHRLHGDGEFEGTGIGLATVRRIIERHGGRVHASGAPGAGAEFLFSLGGVPTQPADRTTSPRA